MAQAKGKIAKLERELETAESTLKAVRVQVKSGTSLSWRMQRIRAILEKNQ